MSAAHYPRVISINMTEGQYRALQRLSFRTHQSLGALARVAVCALLDYEADDEHLALLRLKEPLS